MLVASVDKLGKRPAQAVREMPSDQRFAVTVFTGFAVALAVLGLLFLLTADAGSNRGNRSARQPANVVAPEPTLRVQTGPTRADSGPALGASALP